MSSTLRLILLALTMAPAIVAANATTNATANATEIPTLTVVVDVDVALIALTTVSLDNIKAGVLAPVAAAGSFDATADVEKVELTQDATAYRHPVRRETGGFRRASQQVVLAPKAGTPCLTACNDPASPSCQTCCRTVTHEIDWGCSTLAPGSTDTASCCKGDWDATCWNVASAANHDHACNQCQNAPITLTVTFKNACSPSNLDDQTCLDVGAVTASVNTAITAGTFCATVFISGTNENVCVTEPAVGNNLPEKKR